MTSTYGDLALLALAVGLALALLAIGAVVRSVRASLHARRPLLPDADLPPAGLGRLVPVGEQVDAEVRRGLAALETWLLDARRA